ncbi:hypothetical protein H4Q26_004056 [Puccinia striiformis f. sp. tritici PST-130]|uniref:Uncharacterized protein n=1 Tax=Puccinia striiformis f. sp. tritici PST-78 TaxID=1165861 RepID=A0A0L0USC0_9BASI|nr:hypothetical protein H4Q26_004056 [Puccinia striiformis f. sp. tritici PST-130]KNE89890.1 hypothetical protein PSTG_16653 [Puccinia striiformis f. sp. tritici PST-78]
MSMDQENTSQVNSDHSYLNQSASCLLLQIDLGYRSNPSIVLVTSHKRLQLLLYYYSWHLFLLLQTTPQSPLASYSLHVCIGSKPTQPVPVESPIFPPFVLGFFITLQVLLNSSWARPT